MSSSTIKYTLVALFLATYVSDASAVPKSAGLVLVQAHAGQRDTDGILSPGEVPNANIDYDRAQRHAERSGDYRVENPDNDALAADDRQQKLARERREREDRERYDRERHDHDHDRYDDRRDDSYWNR